MGWPNHRSLGLIKLQPIEKAVDLTPEVRAIVSFHGVDTTTDRSFVSICAFL